MTKGNNVLASPLSVREHRGGTFLTFTANSQDQAVSFRCGLINKTIDKETFTWSIVDEIDDHELRNTHSISTRSLFHATQSVGPNGLS